MGHYDQPSRRLKILALFDLPLASMLSKAHLYAHESFGFPHNALWCSELKHEFLIHDLVTIGCRREIISSKEEPEKGG